MKKYIVTSVCTLALSLVGAFGFNSNAMADLRSTNSNIYTTTIEQNVTNTNNNLTYKNIDLSKCKSVNQVIKTLRKNGCKKFNSQNIMNNKALKNIIVAVQKKNCTSNKASAAQPTTASTPTTKPVVTPTTKPATTPQSTPTAAASNNTGLSSYANQVLQLVNQERAKAGLQSFTTTSALSAAANKRAQEIKQSFSHTRPNGSSCFTVLPEYNVSYRTAGENIAYGQKTPQEVVTGWMNSPGHRANILNANFGKIGIGVYQSNGVYYWSQEFTN